MRRTRFRRKRRELWLPVYGSEGFSSEGITRGNGLGGSVQLTNDGSEDGGIDWLASPVTFDAPIPPEQAQNTGGALGVGFQPQMRDMVAGQEYFLRRVVGKLFVTVSEADGNAVNSERAPAIECGAGLIVVNVDEEGVPLTDFDEVNPLAQESAEDPWIWIRWWLLGTTNNSSNIFYNSSNTVITPQVVALPPSNVYYGSVLDGPHVDQKTVRHVKRDQRLFMVVATRPTRFDGISNVTSDITVDFRWKLRLLGHLSSAAGNRGNAAR